MKVTIEKTELVALVETVRQVAARSQMTTWSLDGKTKKAKVEAVRLCQSCFAAMRGRTCPQCGTEVEVNERPLPSVADSGELEAVDPVAVRAMHRDEERGARTLEDFQRIARARGYKPGWAHYRFEARLARRTYKFSKV